MNKKTNPATVSPVGGDNSADQIETKVTPRREEWKAHAYPRGERRGGKVIAEYDYLDENREPYHRVERTTEKQFPQSHWIRGVPGFKRGHWEYGAPKGPKIPYFLPDLIAAAPEVPVYVCEGEKDVESIIDLGLVATCNPGGAGKWTDDLN
jgi:hypothetical protein